MAKRHRLNVRVHYETPESLVLRTEQDWDRDLAPLRARKPGKPFEFALMSDTPHLYLKAVLGTDTPRRWSQGPNHLAVADQPSTLELFPYFSPDTSCSVCSRTEVESRELGQMVSIRVFLPPGYEENQLQRYPVLYMQDGHNLFFPDEAAFGQDWQIRETLAVLGEMNQIAPVIVVGIKPSDRMAQYTAPGYEAYGRFLALELKPLIDKSYRTMPQREKTAVMGSSLGGVVSLHVAWAHADQFGAAACLSSTFGYRDDLFQRIERESKRPLRVYLDSGWPHDNFERTRAMRASLRRSGFSEGSDLLYFAFPQARHNEASWANRCHLPLQFLFGS